MWAWPTVALSNVVSKVAGGHRWGSHDPAVGPAAVLGLTYLASLNPWTALAVLALTIGAALHALAFAIPGRVENTVIGNLALSWGGAWALTHYGHLNLTWLPWALAGGALVHIAGDLLTVGGVPRPFAVLLPGRRRRMALGFFRTGNPIEHVIAAVCAITAVYLLSWHTGYLPGPAHTVNALHGMIQ